jgi:hypothetical protein
MLLLGRRLQLSWASGIPLPASLPLVAQSGSHNLLGSTPSNVQRRCGCWWTHLTISRFLLRNTGSHQTDPCSCKWHTCSGLPSGTPSPMVSTTEDRMVDSAFKLRPTGRGRDGAVLEQMTLPRQHGGLGLRHNSPLQGHASFAPAQTE